MASCTKLTAAIALSLTCSTLLAAGLFPRGCEVSGFGFNDPHLLLNDTGNQTLYLIQNRSNIQIELEHIETHDVFMSPKLETKLGALQWAAFASDVSNMHFKCFTRVEGVETPLNCREVLDVCQYPRVKFALSNMGSYWVSTNKPQSQVIKDATVKGIYLKW